MRVFGQPLWDLSVSPLADHASHGSVGPMSWFGGERFTSRGGTRHIRKAVINPSAPVDKCVHNICGETCGYSLQGLPSGQRRRTMTPPINATERVDSTVSQGLVQPGSAVDRSDSLIGLHLSGKLTDDPSAFLLHVEERQTVSGRLRWPSHESVHATIEDVRTIRWRPSHTPRAKAPGTLLGGASDLCHHSAGWMDTGGCIEATPRRRGSPLAKWGSPRPGGWASGRP